MRPLRALFAGLLLASAMLGASSGGVLAYGKADSPLAQIEVSANCDNPSFPLCAAPPAGVGLGGIWLWIEIDANGWSDVAGAGCSHLNGVNGAGPARGTAQWWSFHGSVAALEAAFPHTFVVGADPNSDYYVVPFGFAFPKTTGHYSVNLATGVFIQAQVAP